MQMHPEKGDSALMVIQGCFGHGTRAARSGSALALKACAEELTGEQVTNTLDFLLGHGLADHDDEVRSQMVAAGDSVPHTVICANLSTDHCVRESSEVDTCLLG